MIQNAHVIGMGRLGKHLAHRLGSLGIHVHRWSRTASAEARGLEEWPEFTECDAVFLAVPDDSIAEVAQCIRKGIADDTLLVHHAGSVPLDVLPSPDAFRAVMWPPMTFSSDQAPDWDTLPLGVESPSSQWMELGQRIAPNAFQLTADSRPKLHLGAVLAGNLTAAWIGTVETYLNAHDLPLKSLEPLIKESVHKSLIGNALTTVSGPASRNDRSTLEQQVTALQSEAHTLPEMAQLHRILTNLILQHHGHPTLPPVQTETP